MGKPIFMVPKCETVEEFLALAGAEIIERPAS
jgi:hypothetical protein